MMLSRDSDSWRLGFGAGMLVEPELHAVEKVKARPVYDQCCIGLVFSPEEDRRGKDPLEALNDATVVRAILGEAEEIEHLRSRIKTNNAALLFECQGRNPN